MRTFYVSANMTEKCKNNNIKRKKIRNNFYEEESELIAITFLSGDTQDLLHYVF